MGLKALVRQGVKNVAGYERRRWPQAAILIKDES